MRFFMVSLPTYCIVCESKPAGKKFIDKKLIKFMKCPQCSLIWRTYPEKDPTNYDEGKYFVRYEKRREKKSILRSLDRQTSYIEQFVDKKENLLEIGCSVGYFLKAARSKGWHVVGTDISSYAVNRCIEQGFEAYTKDLSELISMEVQYQVVVLKHVFEHFPDPLNKLDQLKQLVAPDGLLVINVPNGNYYKIRLLKGYYKKMFSPKVGGYQHYYYYNHLNLCKLLENVNFKPVMINSPSNIFLDQFKLSKDIFSIFKKVL